MKTTNLIIIAILISLDSFSQYQTPFPKEIDEMLISYGFDINTIQTLDFVEEFDLTDGQIFKMYNNETFLSIEDTLNKEFQIWDVLRKNWELTIDNDLLVLKRKKLKGYTEVEPLTMKINTGVKAEFSNGDIEYEYRANLLKEISNGNIKRSIVRYNKNGELYSIWFEYPDDTFASWIFYGKPFFKIKY